MKRYLLLFMICGAVFLAACGPSSVEPEPGETPGGPALQPADAEGDVLPRSTITATAVPQDGYPARPTPNSLPAGYAMPQAAPTVRAYPGISPSGEDQVWMSIPAGEQCAEALVYPTEQDAVDSLETAGIAVYESQTVNLPVITVCGAPTSTQYLALIDIEKQEDAQEMGWLFAE